MKKIRITLFVVTGAVAIWWAVHQGLSGDTQSRYPASYVAYPSPELPHNLDSEVTINPRKYIHANKLAVYPASASASASESQGYSLPASLRGSEVPSVNFTSSGGLIIDGKLKDFFEYFITTLGESDQSEIVEIIEAQITDHFPVPAQSRALSVFKEFMAYKKALGESTVAEDSVVNFGLVTNNINYDDIYRHYELREDLRNQFLQPEVNQAFFGESRLYDEITLKKLQIRDNPDLTAEQKEDWYARLDQQLSPLQRMPAQKEMYLIALQDMAQQPVSSAEKLQKRRLLVGEEAAIRLAELDKKRKNWNRRVEEYRQAKQLIERNRGISARDKHVLVSELRLQHFKESEMIRIEAIDRIRHADK